MYLVKIKIYFKASEYVGKKFVQIIDKKNHPFIQHKKTKKHIDYLPLI
jgi:hypothetical protein